MKKQTVITAIAALCLFGLSMDLQAQCKSFTKRKCMKQLEDYSSNGQYNGAVMFEGEEATLMQTFYSTHEYRLIVCAQPSIADSMYYEIQDYRGKVVYSSKDAESSIFDFDVESTQQLKIKVFIPGRSAGMIKKNGCVSILIGFKER